MRLPDKVKIGVHEYKVEFVEGLWDSTTHSAQVSFDRAIIRIDPHQPDTNIWEDLWHEVLHIIDKTYGAGLDEQKIMVLGATLHQFWADNFKEKEVR